MSSDNIFTLGSASAADAPFGAPGQRLALEPGLAGELLRQRIGVTRGHTPGLALQHAVETEHPPRARPPLPEPHREVLGHLIARAYLQLLAGDSAAARQTLEHAVAIGGPPPGQPAPAAVPAIHVVRSVPPAGSGGSALAPAPTARVMVRTLGTFEVLVDGVCRPEGKKQPRKTLALLKSIVAMGGKDVCRAALADVLWPELDGDKAQNALTVTLHRLRTYLGVPGTVAVRHGRLSLEPQHVWVDSLELETAARTVNPPGTGGAVERILELYRGPFLSADGEEPWTVRPRERLRSRFVCIVAGAAGALEAAGRLADAVALYERGLAADDLVGAFHDGLVRCLVKLGRGSEADWAHGRKAKLAPAGLE